MHYKFNNNLYDSKNTFVSIDNFFHCNDKYEYDYFNEIHELFKLLQQVEEEEQKIFLLKKLKSCFNSLEIKSLKEIQIVDIITYCFNNLENEIQYFELLKIINANKINKSEVFDYFDEFNLQEFLNDFFLIKNNNYHQLFRIIALYISSSYKMHDIAINNFNFHFIDLLDFKSDKYFEDIINIISSYLIFPLEYNNILKCYEIISTIYNRTDLMFENELISTILLSVLYQENWFKAFQKYNCLEFVINCFNHQQVKSIMIIKEYCKFKIPPLSVFNIIIQNTIENYDKLEKEYYLCLTSILNICFVDNNICEELLRVGGNLILEIMMFDCCYEIKEMAMETILTLIENGTIQQQRLIIELGILPLLASMLETTNINIIERTIDSFNILFYNYTNTNELEIFLKEFNESKCIDILKNISINEPNVIQKINNFINISEK